MKYNLCTSSVYLNTVNLDGVGQEDGAGLSGDISK